jgi:hypothetical protein
MSESWDLKLEERRLNQPVIFAEIWLSELYPDFVESSMGIINTLITYALQDA